MKNFIVFLSTISILSAGTTMVRDSSTHLIWEDTTHSEETKVTFKEAKSYCKELQLGEYNNWRLPTLGELLSIVNYKKYKPAIIDGFTQVNKDTLYWSSTPYIKEADEYWGVSFKDGSTSNASINYDRYVRCVRYDKR
jgi:hypothetical protein